MQSRSSWPEEEDGAEQSWSSWPEEEDGAEQSRRSQPAHGTAAAPGMRLLQGRGWGWQPCPTACRVAGGSSGEHHREGWSSPVTLPWVTSSCQCQAAIPTPALPRESRQDPFLLLLLINSCKGRTNPPVGGCPGLAQGIAVITQARPASPAQRAPWQDRCRAADETGSWRDWPFLCSGKRGFVRKHHAEGAAPQRPRLQLALL